MSSFEESDEFKAAQAAFEKKKSRPSVRNVIERYIDADDADAVARAVERGDFDAETATELGLNTSKIPKQKDGDDDGGGDDDDDSERERGPRRRKGYFGPGGE